jgi:hypothetical protein
MDSHQAVVHLSTASVPLPTDAHGLFAALGRAGLVQTTNGLEMGVVFGHDLLAAVSEFLFIPLDRFEKAL